jgi:hypothetical protein
MFTSLLINYYFACSQLIEAMVCSVKMIRCVFRCALHCKKKQTNSKDATTKNQRKKCMPKMSQIISYLAHPWPTHPPSHITDYGARPPPPPPSIHTYNQICTRALSVKFHFSVLYSFNVADFNASANLKR